MSDLSKCGEACNCMKCRGADTDIDDIWANSEWVVDPFDTYEPHELPPSADAAKLLGIFKANPCLDTIDLRVGWAMQSPFRSMGVESITEIAKSIDASKSSCIALCGPGPIGKADTTLYAQIKPVR